MLFVCHSSIDRDEIVKPILFNLYNFGFDIWYDHKKLFLSDKLSTKIYKEGIMQCSDILIIYSQNLVNNSVCARNELDIIYKNCANKVLYPVLVNSKMSDYTGQDLDVISSIIHYVATPTNSHQVAIQIAIHIVERILKTKSIDPSINSIVSYGHNNIVKTYNILPPFALNERVAFLLCYANTIIDRNIIKSCDCVDTVAIIADYISKIHLLCIFTENDVKLMELLCVLITCY